MVLLCVSALIKSIRSKILDKLKAIKDQMIWSGIIKSIMLTYLKNFVTFFLAVKLLLDESHTPEASIIITTILTGLPLVLFPIWSAVFLYRNKDKLQTLEMQKKYNGLYSDL